MDILCTEGPFVLVVFGRKGVAVLGHTAQNGFVLVIVSCDHLSTAARPSEGTDANALHRHHPQAADDILALVLVFLIDTLTIVNTHLIVQQATTVAVGEQVTLYLQTDVASTRTLFASTVAKAREVVHHQAIAIPSLSDGVGGVFKGESTLELTGTHTELLVFCPFGIEVNQHHGGVARAGIRCSLQLNTPVEVANLAVQNQTGQTQVKLIVLTVGLLSVLGLILQHAVAANLDILHPGRHFYGCLVFLLLHLGFFSTHGACGGYEQRHEPCQE